MKRPRRFKPRRGKPNEIGAIVKSDKSLTKAALVYPNTYQAGMSNLGFQTVYMLANRLETVSCERVFLPDRHSKNQKPVSVETGKPLAEFDIILFSISFENDFIHLVHLLREAGIPPRSPDRNTIHPLVIAGGVACFLNPEPIAEFIDCFLLGEAEVLLEPFFEHYTKAPDRYDLLGRIEAILPGAYVPSRHPAILWDHTAPDFSTIPIRHVTDLSETRTMTQILTDDTAFKQSILIETGRGCPHGCRFCSAGYIYRPPRIYPVSVIKDAMDHAKGLTRKIGLVSSAVSNHPDLSEICAYGAENDLVLSFSSLRADALTDDLIEKVAQSGVKTATIAPEAGSQRMRDIINKKLDKPVILSCVKRFVAAGIPNIRLYFMVGLPFETMEDVQAVAGLTLKIKQEFLESAREKKKIGTITLSINPFIPKPATPFQWAAMLDIKTLKQRIDLIRSALKTTPNVKIHVESLKQARINAFLARADRRASVLIESALDKGWNTVIKSNTDYINRVIHTPHPQDTVFPWDMFTNGVKKSFLLKEFERAQKHKTTPSCPMIDCIKCGICMSKNL